MSLSSSGCPEELRPSVHQERAKHLGLEIHRLLHNVNIKIYQERRPCLEDDTDIKPPNMLEPEDISAVEDAPLEITLILSPGSGNAALQCA